MPYYGYYGGYGDFLANNIYCILLIPVLLLSLWAQAQVSGNFKRYSGVANRRRLTGAQAAEAVLRAHGVYNVAIRPCSGNLTDHYDPRDNSISLSENVYNSTSIAAVGVAAHEAGHAVQYAENYGPVRLRTAIIPATQIGSKFSFILLPLPPPLCTPPTCLRPVSRCAAMATPARRWTGSPGCPCSTQPPPRPINSTHWT